MSDIAKRLRELVELFNQVRHVSRPTYAGSELSGLVSANLPYILDCIEIREGIEGLAKTADGQIVRIGLTVYCPNGHAKQYRPSDVLSGTIYCTSGECWSEGCQGDSGSGTHYEAGQCTTLHAAIQAAKGKE